MDTDTTRQEIESLRQEIAFHNYRYHVLDQPLISDYEFDQLMQRLRKMEADYPSMLRLIRQPKGQAVYPANASIKCSIPHRC
jgi:NAD-dependent DNA ligase